MTNENGQNDQVDIDPLNDSIETVRAKHAEERTGRAGDGSFVPHLHKLAAENRDKRVSESGSAYGDFLFNSAGSLSRPAWSDSTGGRAAIRLVSRGVVGAAFYAIGGRMSRAQLMGYDPHTFSWKEAQPLERVAYVFDVGLGKPIAAMTRGIARLSGKQREEAEQIAWNAVNFRPKAYYHAQPGHMVNGQPANGRSLGHEITSVSFDFAMMSVGDAMTRNFVQMIDPNIKKTWMVNENGDIAEEGQKAHFSLKKWTQSTGRAAWRIFSKNQGEDWAVAPLYVYQMKAQRHLLGKAFGKGTKIVFDNGLNGAAWKVNEKGQITGDYQLAGALDLHLRFVGYNVLTLIFREGYDTVSHSFKQWRQHGYPLNLHMPEHIDPLDRARKATRYLVKSTIKANMYMNPAVIPFWLMRTPQSKWRGSMIYAEAEKEMSAIATKVSESSIKQGMKERGADAVINRKDGSLIFNYNTGTERMWGGGPNASNQPTMFLHNTEVPNPLHNKTPHSPELYEHYEKGAGTTFSKLLNPFGQFSYWLGGRATEWVKGWNTSNPIRKYISIEEGGRRPGQTPTYSDKGVETFMRNMVDAGTAYAPYFWAKAELGLRVDDRKSDGGLGQMDKAIYRLMDNTVGLDFKAARKTLGDMWHLSTTIHGSPISREGGLSEAEKPKAKLPEDKVPATAIETKGSVHEKPADLSRDPVKEAQGIIDRGKRAAHVPVAPELLKGDTPETLDAATNNRHDEKRWAEKLAGRNLAAQYIEAPAHTRH